MHAYRPEQTRASSIRMLRSHRAKRATFRIELCRFCLRHHQGSPCEPFWLSCYPGYPALFLLCFCVSKPRSHHVGLHAPVINIFMFCDGDEFTSSTMWCIVVPRFIDREVVFFFRAHGTLVGMSFHCGQCIRKYVLRLREALWVTPVTTKCKNTFNTKPAKHEVPAHTANLWKQINNCMCP